MPTRTPGDIVAVLPRRERAIVDGMFMHASASAKWYEHAAHAAEKGGWAAARSGPTKRTRPRKYGPDYALDTKA